MFNKLIINRQSIPVKAQHVPIGGVEIQEYLKLLVVFMIG